MNHAINPKLKNQGVVTTSAGAPMAALGIRNTPIFSSYSIVLNQKWKGGIILQIFQNEVGTSQVRAGREPRISFRGPAELLLEQMAFVASTYHILGDLSPEWQVYLSFLQPRPNIARKWKVRKGK